MAISFKRYVDVISGVGVGTVVPNRDLIARIFTTNPLLPTKSYAEFESATEVGTYFGTSSEEYLRASFYFGWTSKNITRPKKLSFARWVDAAAAPRIYGSRTAKTLAAFTAIEDGAFSLTMGPDTHVIDTLDFSGAGTLAAVATIIQAGINAESGLQWTGATVSYNVSRGSFDLVGGSAVAATISVQATGSGTDIGELLGWRPEGVTSTTAIWSDGAAVETITETLDLSADASTNFGSFVFIPTLTKLQLEEAAAWNVTQNVLYQFHSAVSAANATEYAEALAGSNGLGLTLSKTAGEYPELAPTMVLAATNYNNRNAVQNYMFQQFDLTPSVTTDEEANAMDALGINYYGRTQTAGVTLDFYQRGTLMGLATSPLDMNTYANEQWLKDAAGAIIMSLLLGFGRIPANDAGCAQILAVLQTVIEQALVNGTISVGKPLSTVQKLYIAEITGDDTAWYQVQSIGYWKGAVAVPAENKILYTLVYSKDDIVRKVEGTHILI